uniref:Uncharacterized protein n=1 Tax=Amphimedon queenslandica TaxID=400682 RepID=A0A1X7VII1_AMPQE
LNLSIIILNFLHKLTVSIVILLVCSALSITSSSIATSDPRSATW